MKSDDEMDFFYDAVLALKTREEAQNFFRDLCTFGELEAISSRLSVAKMLRAGCVFHEITEKTGVSTATISRVNRAIKDGTGGYDCILSRLDETKK